MIIFKCGLEGLPVCFVVVVVRLCVDSDWICRYFCYDWDVV